LIFVSSRRQTRLTANDLISFGANDFQLKSPFLRMSEDEVSSVVGNIKDDPLRQSLQFGIGMHHAGLDRNDRKIVEELFEMSKIQILVATTTLAWGVNFPAKLVIVKGTEFFDPKLKAYVDMPISDILQMIGRAGRPQYNDKGYACVYVEKTKKNFYRKYLNDPFPIESEFLSQILEHLNAEIASGTVANKQQCVDYLTWTYFFRRLVRNPLYYGLNDNQPETVQKYLNDLVDSNVQTLISLGCISTDEDQFLLVPTFLGRLAAKYYIQPQTSNYLYNSIKDKKLPATKSVVEDRLEVQDMIEILSYCVEFEDVPVRHHEPEMNLHLSDMTRYPTDLSDPESPHFKTHLLFQAYLSDLPLPIRDYHTDTKTVLDNANRLIAAMVEVCAELNRFRECLNLLSFVQMLIQGVWSDESPLVNIPGFDTREILFALKNEGISTFKDLTKLHENDQLVDRLKRIPGLGNKDQKTVVKSVSSLPNVSMKVKVYNYDSENNKPILKKGDSIKEESEAVVMCYLENTATKSFKGTVNVKKMKKPKRSVWWLVIGNLHTNELYAIKKMEIGRKSTKKLVFEVPIFKAKESSILDIRLICDSYVGLDLGTTINLESYKTT
jgi:activating signal cointegrator complex subunit 3